MLGPVSSYNYLNKSGCVTVPTVNDAADYNVLSDAMKTLKFQPHRKSIFQTLSGILLLGNTTFVAEGDAAKIANPQGEEFLLLLNTFSVTFLTNPSYFF